jgi:hypothetical protein
MHQWLTVCQTDPATCRQQARGLAEVSSCNFDGYACPIRLTRQQWCCHTTVALANTLHRHGPHSNQLQRSSKLSTCPAKAHTTREQREHGTPTATGSVCGWCQVVSLASGNGKKPLDSGWRHGWSCSSAAAGEAGAQVLTLQEGCMVSTGPGAGVQELVT